MAMVLEEVEVKELVSGKKKLVYVDVEDTLDHALELLAEHNIVAMPTREVAVGEDSEGNEKRELKFCGMLSVLDVAALVAREPGAFASDAEPVKVERAVKRTAESWHMLLLDPHATVARAMEFLGPRGFHRALVPNFCLCEHSSHNVPLPSALVQQISPNAPGEEFRVLSQLDLARFIMSHEGRFGLSMAQSLENLGLDSGRVLATTRDEKLKDALARMATHAVSALAVVQALEPGSPWAAPDAGLLDTLSASDIRGCSIADLQEAGSTTVGEFLAKKQGQRKPLSCTKETHLRTALKEMVDAGVHRLWVVREPEAEDKPAVVKGVVTLSDAVRLMRMLPVTMQQAEDAEGGGMEAFMWMEWV